MRALRRLLDPASRQGRALAVVMAAVVAWSQVSTVPMAVAEYAAPEGAVAAAATEDMLGDMPGDIYEVEGELEAEAAGAVSAADAVSAAAQADGQASDGAQAMGAADADAQEAGESVAASEPAAADPEQPAASADAQQGAAEAGQDASAAPANQDGLAGQDAAQDATPAADQDAQEAPSQDAQGAQDAAQPSYPAFTGYAVAGGLVVKVTAPEGVLPEGTTVQAVLLDRQDVVDAVAEAVEGAGRTLEGAVAVDVTLVGPDGSAIQPAGSVNVRIYNAGLGEGEEVGVYRVADDATSVEEIQADMAEADVQSFDVDHFSIYVVTDEGVPALATYYFHGADGNVIAGATQIVKDGDALYEPPLPEQDGAVFAGWYTAAEGGQAFAGFGTVSGVVAGDVHLYARFTAAVNVFFMDGTGEGARVIATRTGAPGQVVETAGVSFAVGADQSIVGWYTSPELLDSQRAESVTLGTADVVLYPKVANGHWATFDSQGGSYVEPLFVPAGSLFYYPDNPTKTGYNFFAWTVVSSDTGFTPYEGQELTEDVHFMASWRAASGTSYTVIHWQQNANDDGYSYKDIDYSSGKTGEQTNARAKTYAGFTAKAFTQAEISGDGSTIVNIYYDRNIYTVKFYDMSGQSEYENKAITARYGASIGDKWPTVDSSSTWATSPNGREYQVNIDTMPLGGDSFYGPKTGKGSETASYYVQVLPGQTPDVTKFGIGYVLDHQDTSPGKGYTVTSDDKYPITGFTLNGRISTWDNMPYNGAEFYYTRDQHTITFMNEGAQAAQVAKYFGESISGAGSQTVSAPVGKEDYVFGGWYSDEGCTAEFVFTGKTMPAANIVVYAKWTPPSYTVTAHADVSQGSASCPQTVAKGGLADLSVFDSWYSTATTLPESSQFLGWAQMSSDGTLSLFNASTRIYRDYDLYPYVVSDAAVGVTYHAEDGQGGESTYADPMRYAPGTSAKVAAFSSTGLTAPAGKAFVGWELRGGDGAQEYLPGSNVAIGDSDVHLYARWADAADTVSITYLANYPDGAVVEGDPDAVIFTTDTMPANSEHEVLSLEAAGFSVPTGYEFAGWADLSGDASVVYQPGASVRAGAVGENVLWAQWEPRSDLSYTVRYVWKGADGQPVDIAQAKVVGGQTYGDTAKESPVAVEGYSAMWSYPVELKLTGDAERDVITIWYLLDVELVANSASFEYTGLEQSVDGFAVRVPASGAPVTDADFSGLQSPVTAGASGTDAGTYPATFSADAVGMVDADGRYVARSVVEGSLQISPCSVELTAASATKVYDGQPLAVSAWAVTGGSFVALDGQEGEGIASVAIEGSQTLVGSSEARISGYEFNANTKAGNYVVTTVPGTLTVTDGDEGDPVDPGLVIAKTHEGGTYALGEAVEFTVEAVNIYDRPMTMTFAEQEGVEITGQSVFEDVPAGATVSTTAVATVTEDDIRAGALKNAATVSFSGGKAFEGTDEADVDDVAAGIDVRKRTVNRPDGMSPFQIGDTIRYEVVVTNIGNVTLENVAVEDELEGAVPDEGQAGTPFDLAPGQAVTLCYSYAVTDADSVAGSVKNVVSAGGEPRGLAGSRVSATDWVEDAVVTARPSLHVIKEASAPEDGVAFKLGETVRYTVVAVNNGNVALTDVLLQDPLTGSERLVERLGAGEAVSIDAAYTVTEADVAAGSVENVAAATGVGPDGLPVKDEAGVTVPTEKAVRALEATKTVVSAPADGAAYKAGEAVEFDVTVKNAGNQTLAGVTVADLLEGAALAKGQSAELGALEPGQAATLRYVYEVTSADLGRPFKNVAVVTAEDGTTATAESETVPVADPAPSLAKTGDGTASALPAAMAGSLMCAVGLAWLVWKRHKSC